VTEQTGLENNIQVCQKSFRTK